jgi:hypothetical protein
VLDPHITAVEPVPQRPFQGWRYLEARDAPPDRAGRDDPGGSMPSGMADELRSLGLL